MQHIRICTVLAAFLITILSAEKSYAKVTSVEISLKKQRIVTHELESPATGIAVSFEKEMPALDVQLLERGTWGGWNAVTLDGDAFPWERDSQLLFADDASAVRLRSNADASITLHAISVDRDAKEKLEATAGRSLMPAPVIIPRWQWGANEKLRVSDRGADLRERAFYSNSEIVQRCDLRSYLYPDEFRERERKFTEDVNGDGEEETLLWPVGYSKNIQLIVVHHTAESSPASKMRTDMERMRTIYEYHAVARGWGDIGYNYVIGDDGTIFEGRAGGDYAVGAHTYCNNIGAIGISLMGNFQLGKPTDSQLTALRWLLVTLSDKYKVDPKGSAIFHGKKMPTIVGHRDVGQTACPGQYSEELLPQVRAATKERALHTPLFSTAAVASTKEEAALMESILPLSFTMGDRGIVTVRLMNIGLDTWNGDTWLLGEGDPGLYFTEISPYSFVAGRMKESSVPPGETATFDIHLQAGLSAKQGSLRLTPVINNERRLVRNIAGFGFQTTAGSPRFTIVTSNFPTLHKTGEDLTGTVKLLNSGMVTWEKDTLTELEFDLFGGSGEVSKLSEPQKIAPGEQGSFGIRLHNIDEEGQYKRTLIPSFAEGSQLTGQGILIASRAEPIPAIMLAAAHNAADIGPLSATNTVSMEAGGAVMEAIEGTALTLAPRGQTAVPLRIRTGKNGVSRLQNIAPIARSNPTIVLQDESSLLRMREVYRSPISLQPYKAADVKLVVIAPTREGEYTFSIGGIPFTLSVRAGGRPALILPVESTPAPRKLIVRTKPIEEIRIERRAQRAKSKVQNAPPPAPVPEKTDLRILLSYNKESSILTSSSTVRMEGNGVTLFEDGPIHLALERDFCTVSTVNGSLFAPVVRFSPIDAKSFIEIATEEKSANRFRGVLECRVIDGKITFINELGVEEYMMGLAEEPDTEPWEKQRAFAIAARSYALYYVLSGQKKFPGKPYDGSDDPRTFQAYGGVAIEEKNPRWVEAVKNTAGQVLAYQRKLIKPPYFSSDDGQTKSALEVWGWKNVPYLDGKPDPWCLGMQNSGHGVGMSGCGAEGQANEGKTAEAILQYYYPTTHVMPLEKVFEWEKRLGGEQ